MASGRIRVDIQNEYFPGGRMELAGIQQASANAGELLALFRDRGWPIFHVQHLSEQADAPLFTPGTSDAEIHESVKPFQILTPRAAAKIRVTVQTTSCRSVALLANFATTQARARTAAKVVSIAMRSLPTCNSNSPP
ncbi:MAG TPA: isochorismatase family protein, partial [Gemmataceae bacterium]